MTRSLMMSAVLCGCALGGPHIEPSGAMDPVGTLDLVATVSTGACAPTPSGFSVTMRIRSESPGAYVVTGGVYDPSAIGPVACTTSQCSVQMVERGPIDPNTGGVRWKIFASLRLDAQGEASGAMLIQSYSPSCTETLAVSGALRE